MSQNLLPVKVPAPGRILSRELEARGWTQEYLASIMNCSLQTIDEIIKGSKQINGEIALKLSEGLGTTVEFWTNLETKYQLYLAKKKSQLSSVDH
jgi:addiction module HigA family antidote